MNTVKHKKSWRRKNKEEGKEKVQKTNFLVLKMLSIDHHFLVLLMPSKRFMNKHLLIMKYQH